LRRPNQPFALVVSMNPPHTPYHLHPKKYSKPYADMTDDQLCRRPDIPAAGTKYGDLYRKNIRDYYAMITGVDEQVGRIMDALAASGQADNTILVFTADHGNCLGIHDHATKNVPEEESMRIPLLIRYPGILHPRHDDLLISVPDIYPTLLDLMRVARNPQGSTPSFRSAPVVRLETCAHGARMWQPKNLMGFRDNIPSSVEGVSLARRIVDGTGPSPTSQLYLWIPCEAPGRGRRGVRTRQYTLVVNHMPGQEPTHVLYDRRADPYQLKNIADEQPEIVEQLIRDELDPWLTKTHDPWLDTK